MQLIKRSISGISRKDYSIILQLAKTANADTVFSTMLSRYKLYAIQFFGFKATSYQRRKITRLWNNIMFCVAEGNCPTDTKYKDQAKRYLGLKHYSDIDITNNLYESQFL